MSLYPSHTRQSPAPGPAVARSAPRLSTANMTGRASRFVDQPFGERRAPPGATRLRRRTPRRVNHHATRVRPRWLVKSTNAPVRSSAAPTPPRLPIIASLQSKSSADRVATTVVKTPGPRAASRLSGWGDRRRRLGHAPGGRAAEARAVVGADGLGRARGRADRAGAPGSGAVVGVLQSRLRRRDGARAASIRVVVGRAAGGRGNGERERCGECADELRSTVHLWLLW